MRSITRLQPLSSPQNVLIHFLPLPPPHRRSRCISTRSCAPSPALLPTFLPPLLLSALFTRFSPALYRQVSLNTNMFSCAPSPSLLSTHPRSSLSPSAFSPPRDVTQHYCASVLHHPPSPPSLPRNKLTHSITPPSIHLPPLSTHAPSFPPLPRRRSC